MNLLLDTTRTSPDTRDKISTANYKKPKKHNCTSYPLSNLWPWSSIRSFETLEDK